MPSRFKKPLFEKLKVLFAEAGFDTSNANWKRAVYTLSLGKDMTGVVILDYRVYYGKLYVEYRFGIAFQEVKRLTLKLFPDDEEISDWFKEKPFDMIIGVTSTEYRSWIDKFLDPCPVIDSEKKLSNFLNETKKLIPEKIMPYFRDNASIQAASRIYRAGPRYAVYSVREVLVHILSEEYDFAESVIREGFLSSRSPSTVAKGEKLLELVSSLRAGNPMP
jgi:hypothetical protein